MLLFLLLIFCCWYQQWYFGKGVARRGFMGMKLEYASITNKKINSFAEAVMEIFNFFLYRDFWATLYDVFLPICEKIKFLCWDQ